MVNCAEEQTDVQWNWREGELISWGNGMRHPSRKCIWVCRTDTRSTCFVEVVGCPMKIKTRKFGARLWGLQVPKRCEFDIVHKVFD